ncbi:LamG-like jellyroll fold domain-containing protein [Halosimplex halophilum]|uniref:LamG-like jellyroll fold domain-containing protein n=1 Tax=Halosimplex halophilum TaxID=2559572 RepID=UPI00107FACCD|nr:LamG-like jellyroll fold domain-containing protein [Halosimplex halophilum]
MSEVREATADLVESRPAAEDALRDILAADESGPWSFDDVAVDSGTFGEIVAAGIVEEVDDGYRVADPDAVRGALDGSPGESQSGGGGASLTGRAAALRPASVDRRAVAALAVALLAVAVVRVALPMGAVFRNGDIVLSGNDPYLYRYWGEQLLERPAPALDPTALGSLPSSVATHDVAMVVAVWWTAALFGGTPETVGLVLAWYPVAAGVVSAALVYLVTVSVSADRRAGLAAVALLAVTPVHAFRTSLGFGDHHAFDYVWLAVAAYALVLVARERIDRDGPRLGVSATGWAAVAALSTAVTVQVTAWRGGPLLVAPLGLYALARSLADVRADRSPLSGSGPLLVALAGSAALTLALHALYGWLELYRALAPALLAVGSAFVVAAGELAHRRDLAARRAAAAEVGVGLAVTAVAWVAVPAVSEGVGEFLAYMREFGGSGIAETASLFSGAQGSLFAPLLLFGFVAVVALPVLAWAPVVGYREDRPAWLALGAYGWYLFALAVVQIRFAGQLSLFTAVFGGVGFVRLAAWVDIAEPSTALSGSPAAAIRGLGSPDLRTVGYVAVLFLLVGSLGMVQSPVKISQVTTDDATYGTAASIDDHAAAHDRTFPRNYVFSQWGRNRVYNYFVNGRAFSYGFALAEYESFVSATDPGDARAALSGREGYVVTAPAASLSDSTMQARLHRQFGSRSGSVAGLGHYRLIHDAGEGEQKAFAVVDGARVVGAGPANASVTLSVPVTVGNTSFTYERRVRTGPTGDVTLRVPYEGTYDLPLGNSSVTAAMVREGAQPGQYLAHWAFESAGTGTAVDRIGGHNGTVDGATPVAGPRGSALSFDAADGEFVNLGPDAVDLSGREAFTTCSWARVDDPGGPGNHDVLHLGTYEVVLSYDSANERWISYFHNGTEPNVVRANATGSGEWSHVCGRYDGEALSLWVDGERAGSVAASGAVRDSGGVDAIGGTGRRDRFFDGAVDDVHVYERALAPSEIRTLYGYGANETGR